MNFGYLVSECKAALRLYGADDENSIMQSMNMALMHLCQLRSWAALRRKVTISFSGADVNNSMLLPGDCAGIDSVWEVNHHHEYIASDQAYSENNGRHSDERLYRWFYTQPEADAFAILTGVNLAQSASIFSCDNWLDSYINEYCQIGNELGFYKLTAANTISPRWYGPQITGGPQGVIQVRPAGSKRFSIVDYDGKFSNAVSVVLYYWVYAPVLYLPNQPILLPDYKPLELLTIINVLGLKDRKESIADNYRKEYEKALSKMEDLNAEFVPPRMPLNRFGQRMSFTGGEGFYGR